MARGEFSDRGQSVSVFENVRLKNRVLDICNLSTFSKTTHSSLDKDSNSNQSYFIPLLPTTSFSIYQPIPDRPHGLRDVRNRPTSPSMSAFEGYFESFQIDGGRLWDGNNCDYEPMTIYNDHTTAMGSRPGVLVLFRRMDMKLFSKKFSRKTLRS